MWFLLLLNGIALLCLCAGRKAYTGAWPGSPRTTRAGRPYLWEHKTSRRHRAVASRIGIAAPAHFRFLLEKERFSHRITKLLGFCREFQTENQEFDTHVYILSDDPHFQQRLQSSHEVQRLVMRAFDHGVRDIRATGQYLVARLRNPVATPPEEELEPILDALHAVQKIQESAVFHSPSRWLQVAAHVFRRLPLILMLWALAAFLICQLLDYQIIDWRPLWPIGGEITAVLLLIVLTAIWVLFRNSSEGHAVLLSYLYLTSWSSPLCIAALLWFANCHYDTTPPEIHQREVQAKYSRHSRKSASYYLQIQHWEDASRMLELRISRSFYHQIQTGDVARIVSRRGWLGMEWVAGIEHRP